MTQYNNFIAVLQAEGRASCVHVRGSDPISFVSGPSKPVVFQKCPGYHWFDGRAAFTFLK